jgi:hypothetical protein
LAGPDEEPLMLEDVFESRAAASLAELVRGGPRLA